MAWLFGGLRKSKKLHTSGGAWKYALADLLCYDGSLFGLMDLNVARQKSWPVLRGISRSNWGASVAGL